MILLDYSQVVIGSFMAVSKGEGVVEEETCRPGKSTAEEPRIGDEPS